MLLSPMQALKEGIYIANRNFASGGKSYSMHVMPVVIDCNVAIGASGATSDLIGPLVTSVTRIKAGVYRVKLADNYSSLFNIKASMKSGVTGSTLEVESMVAATLYQIVTVGDTNWQTYGLPANVTAAVGQVFVASGAGTGTGQVKALIASGIEEIELAGSMMNPTDNTGSIITLRTLASTAAGNTALIEADPASGSRLFIEMYLSNSSVQIGGE